MDYLLDGIRVIDAASFLAGPGAATVMADYGADVVKIEPPNGDGYRTLVGNYPVGYHWLLTSRNKRSIGLNLTRSEGQRLLHKLVESADVFLSNFNEDQQRSYQLGYETLKSINARLVYAQMTGYGDSGPDVKRRAFDITAWWARSGMMEFVRDPGQTPLAPAPGMGDHASAMSMFGAIMTGLYRRERTGAGCHVSTSLIANGVWSNGMALQGLIAGNDLAAYRQERGWHNPFNGVYQTNDGRYIVLSMINSAREWPHLSEALGHPEWQEDPRFSDMRTLMRNRMDLIELINGVTLDMTQQELMQRLDDNAITYAPISTMSDVVKDDQLIANEILIKTGETDGDYDWTINSPISIREESKRPPSRAPDIGQHSSEILSDLGLSEEEIKDLIAQEVVIQSTSA